MADIFLAYSDLNEIRLVTADLLKIKYNLKIVNEDSLSLEKWE